MTQASNAGRPRLVRSADADATRLDVGAQWRKVLSDAADSASRELADAPNGGWPANELRAAASMLCAAIERSLHGDRTPGKIVVAPALPVARLLAGMRRSVLRQSSTGALNAVTAVEMLEAIESIMAQLDDDAGHRFTSRLAGSGGLELIVDVAHDMRSPLGSILFLAEQIRRGQSGAVTPVQERQLGLIYGAALGLSTMASDVMDLARGGEKLVQSEARPFSVSSVFQQVHDVVRPMAEERGLLLRFETDITEARVGQAQAIQRVLLNLVTNAVKFTPSGSVTVTATAVSVSAVRFSVRDTGRGIPESVLGSLFDAFRRRLKPGQYVFSSAGLGLSICQNVVKAMGGELVVESVDGVGSVFEFEVEMGRVS